MPDLPSGTVTFLFTDIERSTQTMEVMGDEAYADALDTHRRLLREAFTAHDGHEIGTEGDSFFVAFGRAHDALAAALDGQRALESGPLRVRMGLHTGEALVRSDGYVGHDVHKAKRVSDAGHGGQILLSQTTADLLGNDASLRDLGPHRLKDLTEAQRIFQAGPGDFPPLRSLESFRTNLPLLRSTFIGRENEIAAVRKLLDAGRLVTLTGIGGCGKTRLALQVGAEVIDAYPDGVFFVDLAPISDPDVVGRTVAGAVGLQLAEVPGTATEAPVEELLLEFLMRRNCLVVLDNCEHLLDACAAIADRILGRCPNVSLLVTSREALALEGEQSFRVPSLSVPDDATSAQSSEAVSLFKTRAHEIAPTFELTPENIDAVVDVCRRLDGIPLAIEFAASRVSHLTPSDIAERLRSSFRMLAGGRRRVQRQQTLQATLDWSHELLTEPERTLLRRLSVFSGSFTLDAAEGVCGGDDLGSEDVLDLMGSLVTKSLVSTDEHTARARYRLFETVRLYAAEKLRDAGEAEAIHGRHRDWYLAWVKSFPWERCLLSQVLARTFDEEDSNLRSALEWSSSEGRFDLVGQMAARLTCHWNLSGRYEEGARWLRAATADSVDLDALDAEDRAGCFIALSWAGLGETETADIADGTAALTLAHRAADQSGEPTVPLVIAKAWWAWLLSVVAAVSQQREHADRAGREAAEALRMADGLPDIAAAMALSYIGLSEMVLRDYAAAVEAFDASRPKYDATEYAGWLYMTHAYAAVCRHVLGHHEQANDHVEALRGESPWATWIAGHAMAAAPCFAATGRVEKARLELDQALEEAVRDGRKGSVEEVVMVLAAVAAILGEHAAAARLFGWVRSQTYIAGRLPSPGGHTLYVHYTPKLREALSPETARSYRDEGGAMTTEEIVSLGRLFLGAEWPVQAHD